MSETYEDESNGTRITATVQQFEKSFMAVSLEQQIIHCDHYELLDFFRKWLPTHQPILEAGSGSGRWVVWFHKQGWKVTGLDWSSSLCERAALAFPDIHFETGDMREMPFHEGQFGSVISLGAVEHTIEGPLDSLREFYRVLKPGGIAIITVPYLGVFRRINRFVNKPIRLLKQNKLLRTIFHKQIGMHSINDAKKGILPHHTADFIISENGWVFFQYHFTKPQMLAFLQKTDFIIVDEFVEFQDEGILHNFGRIAGKYDYQQAKVSFTWLGKILRKVIPCSMVGHMLCYIVKKTQ